MVNYDHILIVLEVHYLCREVVRKRRNGTPYLPLTESLRSDPMSDQLANNAKESAKEPIPRAGSLLDSKLSQQPEPPGSPYKPYTEEPAPEPYKPYAEKPALSEPPYEPYK